MTTASVPVRTARHPSGSVNSAPRVDSVASRFALYLKAAPQPASARSATTASFGHSPPVAALSARSIDLDERHWFPTLFGVLLAGVRCAVLAGASHHAVHHGMCAEAQRQRGPEAQDCSRARRAFRLPQERRRAGQESRHNKPARQASRLFRLTTGFVNSSSPFSPSHSTLRTIGASYGQRSRIHSDTKNTGLSGCKADASR